MRQKLPLLIPITIFLTPLWMYLFWLFSPSKSLNIFILDKTVLTKEGQEHRSLNWILTNLKIKNYYDRFYKVEDDYYGFFPKENKTFETRDFKELDLEEMEILSMQFDMAYYTDTYGIYSSDWEDNKYATERSRKIYGGMTKKEAQFLKMLKEQDKMVLMEFNTIGSPTWWSASKIIRKEFGISWTGWTGRYFDSLDSLRNKELPKWILRNYKKQYKVDWDYDKSGVVLVHADERIIVLENGDDLDFECPLIYTDENYRKEYSLPKFINYPFWFDITYPMGDSLEVISKYQLYTTARGDSILADFKLSKSFPATIHNHRSDRFYYFAGDFADNLTFQALAYLKGIDYIHKSFLYNPRLLINRSKFFWKYYTPLMKKILKDYIKENNELKTIEKTDS